MRQVSMLVASLSGAALVVGSLGMASAQSDHAGGHALDQAATHGAHGHGAGHSGENTLLAPRRTQRALPKLVGIVNDDRDIEISDRTPSPGRYKIVVRDSATRHNWHLYGNGKSLSTTVRGTGRWVFRVRLKVGTYRVVCDPHNDDMEFDLVVRRTGG